MASQFKKISASAKIADGPLYLKSVILAAGADAATVILDNSTDGAGTDLFKMAALAGDTVTWTSGDAQGVQIGTALYATLTGTAPHLTVEYVR